MWHWQATVGWDSHPSTRTNLGTQDETSLFWLAAIKSYGYSILAFVSTWQLSTRPKICWMWLQLTLGRSLIPSTSYAMRNQVAPLPFWCQQLSPLASLTAEALFLFKKKISTSTTPSRKVVLCDQVCILRGGPGWGNPLLPHLRSPVPL